ncbi:GMC family oxidoreductase [uncultured Eudoraea sp.]|uniref:GMC oxidoreductase n=1 Tax=uncultured Eudoraea sp. TaxID=1035614 RepID=UPI00260DD88B|nr:GMC family oxidoreductase [uncultured Eudoraea sp.]
MHVDARKLDNNTIIEGDLCIVGAGAAGISMALDWNNSKKKVILLEGGGFEYDNKIQDLYTGTNTGQRYYPLRSCRLHLFGGTTGHWGGMCSPLDPIDFKERSWVPDSGWPITLNELIPFYGEAQKLLELDAYNYTLNFWQDRYPDFIPFPLDESVIRSKMWQFSPPTRFGKKYREPIISSPNIHLYTYCNLTNIRANEKVNQIREVEVKNHEGKSHVVRAKKFVLACGAIQNARILLASRGQSKNGIGNDRDVVGRYFMEHLEVKSAELWLKNPLSTRLYTFDFDTRNPRAELAITEAIQKEYGILNGSASLTALEIASKQTPLIDLWNNEDPRKSFDKLVANFRESREKNTSRKDDDGNRAFELYTRMEQAPNPNSRVMLSDELDALGVPRPQLNWELTNLDKYSIRSMYHILGEQIGKARIGRIKVEEFLWEENDNIMPAHLGGGWHHMGTTRMSTDPNKGVVDANCKVHGINNLFLAGSGCFATAGAPNPTLTLVALSLRLSNHLKHSKF